MWSWQCVVLAGTKVLHPIVITVPNQDVPRSPPVAFQILLMPSFSISKKFEIENLVCFLLAQNLYWSDKILSPVCIFNLISFFSLAKPLCSKHLKTDCFSIVSSVFSLKVKFDGFWRNSFHMLLLFLHAFPTYLKQWCPTSHCSLLSHLLRGKVQCVTKRYLQVLWRAAPQGMCSERSIQKEWACLARTAYPVFEPLFVASPWI